MGFVKIPPEVLRSFGNAGFPHLTTGNLYFYPNPALRWFFWERLKKVYQACRGVAAAEVLDLGCGGGELLPSLAGSFPRIHGIDFQVEHARKVVEYYELKNVTLIEGDFLKTDFFPGGFDLVVIADVLEHQRDLEYFLRRVLAILKTGGTVVACIPVEGVLYRWGRRVFRLTPPADHFQNCLRLIAGLNQHFQIQETMDLPLLFPFFQVLKGLKP